MSSSFPFRQIKRRADLHRMHAGSMIKIRGKCLTMSLSVIDSAQAVAVGRASGIIEGGER